MKSSTVHKLAEALRVLVEITFVCNIIALFLVPAIVMLQTEGMTITEYLSDLFHPGEDDIAAAGWAFLLLAWFWIVKAWPAVVSVLLLLFCGCCTAIILRQGGHILDTVLDGTPFCLKNASSFQTAAVAAFAIAAALLARWGVDAYLFQAYYHSDTASFPSHPALLVPIFAMLGLLSLILSALFRQAAELKAENDLTI